MASSDDDDDDDDELDPIVPTSQPVAHETVLSAQPAKRSRTVQEPPQQAVKPVKRSKTVDQVIDLPRIDNFQYTSKELKEVNRATRKKKNFWQKWNYIYLSRFIRGWKIWLKISNCVLSRLHIRYQ